MRSALKQMFQEVEWQRLLRYASDSSRKGWTELRSEQELRKRDVRTDNSEHFGHQQEREGGAGRCYQGGFFFF